MIIINFTKTDGVHTLVDAIWLEDDNTFTDDEIELMKQDRFDKYIEFITASIE